MVLNAAIVAVVSVTALLLWSPRLQKTTTWLAATTPLASIIGSGFLVLGPILNVAYGMYAPLVMAALCLAAYLFGAAVRFNIAYIDRYGDNTIRFSKGIEQLASWALSFAYIISVAYYLNLFGAFGVSLTTVDDPVHAKLLTTAVFIVILVVGWTRGFKMLEHLEYVSVTAKLAIIAGLLLGLAVHFSEAAAEGRLVANAPKQSGLAALYLAFGLIVTVQGFETSRYLGQEYDAATRIRSMRWAQWISSAIYLVYILLLAFLFAPGDLRLTETSIIDMMRVVAPILPALLVAAALAAQFSAAVADTSGSGGLITELTKGRMSVRMGYALLTGIGVFLTWSANVFEIISYASRAFALYYMLQAALAAVRARGQPRPDLLRFSLFVCLAILGALIVVLGKPVEV